MRRLALILSLLLAAMPAAAQTALPTQLEDVQLGAAETLFVANRPVAVLRATVGGTKAAERVARAKARIDALSRWTDSSRVVAEAARIGNVEGVFVTSGSTLLFALLPQDLDPETGLTLAEAGDSAAGNLQSALQARADSQRLPVLLRGIGLSLLATVVLSLLLRGIFRLRRRILEHPLTERVSQRLHVHGVDLASIITAVDRALTKLTALGLVVVVLYLYLTFVFRQFPFSEPWGRELGGYLRELLGTFGMGIVHAVPGLFAVVLIMLIARIVSRLTNTFFLSVEDGRLELAWLEPETAKASRRLAIGLIWIFAIIVAYPYVPGSQSPVFKGVSVMVGLMATLGATGVVNHFVSGMVIVYSRACRVGEVIKAGEVEGLVMQVGVLSTKIATKKREEITVPNAVLVSHSIVNYSRLAKAKGAILATTVTIGYDAPWRQVHQLLLQSAAKVDGIRADPAPFVLQRSLSDFYVEYELRMHFDRVEERHELLSLVHQEIQDAFNAAGVQIMSPHFEGQPDWKVWVPRTKWQGLPPEEA